MTATQNFAGIANTTSTLNQMTIDIASGVVYGIRAYLWYASDTPANGISIGILFPAARRSFFQVVLSAAGGAPTLSFTYSNPQFSITSASSVGRMINIDGTLLCSGSGQFLFYAATENTSGTTHILNGSSVLCWNMGPVPGI